MTDPDYEYNRMIGGKAYADQKDLEFTLKQATKTSTAGSGGSAGAGNGIGLIVLILIGLAVFIYTVPAEWMNVTENSKRAYHPSQPGPVVSPPSIDHPAIAVAWTGLGAIFDESSANSVGQAKTFACASDLARSKGNCQVIASMPAGEKSCILYSAIPFTSGTVYYVETYERHPNEREKLRICDKMKGRYGHQICIDRIKTHCNF